MTLPTEDLLLMRRIAEHDQQALLLLYEHYGRRVYSLAYRIVQSTTIAEEVTQDTFLKVWNQSHAWDADKGQLKNWLLTIAQYTAIDRLRKEQRQPSVIANPVEDSTQAMSAIHKDGLRWQEGSTLRMLVEDLPPEQAQLIELAFFQGMTHTQIAHALKLPLGTVKTRLRTGLQGLKKRWLETSE